jgi:hypothetical protein
MSDLDLVFDFDAWKLNGVYIFSEPAAFAFLGTEDTPPTEIVMQPGLLERVAAGLTWRKAQGKRIVRDEDESLVYRKLGLRIEYVENRINCFKIRVVANETLNYSHFPGRFVFRAKAIDLSNNLNPQNIKDIFGEPDEGDIVDGDEWDFISYNINDYFLTFKFNEHQKLEMIEGYC